MGFFDDLPAPEPAPSRRHHPWEPPEAELPGIVPIDTLLLARTDQVAVAVTGLSAFSAGIEIFLTARIRPSAEQPEGHLPGGPRELAASRRSFRFGLQFSDGGKAVGSPGERIKHRPRWLGIVVRPAAAGAPGGLAAVGELQAEPERAAGRGQVPRPAGQMLPGVAGAGPDPRGQEDLDPGGEG